MLRSPTPRKRALRRQPAGAATNGSPEECLDRTPRELHTTERAPRESSKVSKRLVVIAAVAAGVAGAIVGFVLARSQAAPEISFVAAAPAPSLSGASSNRLLLAALDNGESGKSIEQGGRSARIILTFEADDGRYCRAFRSHETSVAAEGVACRNGGQWEVVAWDGTVDPNEGFRAAGASELLDDVMDRLGGGAALEAADERVLIERHWSAPPQ
jgi:hypothetical protein